MHLRHSGLAFRNVPPGLIVSLDRDPESFLDKVHKFPKQLSGARLRSRDNNHAVGLALRVRLRSNPVPQIRHS